MRHRPRGRRPWPGLLAAPPVTSRAALPCGSRCS